MMRKENNPCLPAAQWGELEWHGHLRGGGLTRHLQDHRSQRHWVSHNQCCKSGFMLVRIHLILTYPFYSCNLPFRPHSSLIRWLINILNFAAISCIYVHGTPHKLSYLSISSRKRFKCFFNLFHPCACKQKLSFFFWNFHDNEHHSTKFY